MNITRVQIRLVNNTSRMRGVASITIDDAFVIHEIKIIESSDGLFMAMPSRKTPSGHYKDIAHPIHSECRQMIEDAIMKKYHEELALAEANGENYAGDSSDDLDDDLDEASLHSESSDPSYDKEGYEEGHDEPLALETH